MKNGKNFAKIGILAALFVILLNPSWNPLLTDEARNAVKVQLQNTFGVLAGGGATGIFSPAKLTTALAAAIFVWLVTTVICMVLEKTTAGKRRSETVAGLVTSVVKTLAAIVAVVWVMSIMGVDLAAIFASLGVVSLIVGFGVQSLIEDCVTGIFIILEGQYNIGDVIVLDDFRGTVKKITMRTTTIEDTGFNLKIVNNSDIRNIQNRSRAKSYAVCEVGISYDADIREVEKIIIPRLQGIYDRNPDLFLNPPTYTGVQKLADSAVVIRVIAEIEEEKIFAANRCLNREMKIICDDNGIEIPFNQLVVHTAK